MPRLVASLSWSVSTTCVSCGSDDNDTFTVKIKFQGPLRYLRRMECAERLLASPPPMPNVWQSLGKTCSCGSVEFVDNGITPSDVVFDWGPPAVDPQTVRLCRECDEFFPREPIYVTCAVLAANHGIEGCCHTCGRIRSRLVPVPADGPDEATSAGAPSVLVASHEANGGGGDIAGAPSVLVTSAPACQGAGGSDGAPTPASSSTGLTPSVLVISTPSLLVTSAPASSSTGPAED